MRVAMQELSSGGVLIEISDKGIGVSDARLEEMNWRLDNPPTIDVSVSRHMGLFAVARLAERHRVRVRLRSATPQGLSALVWLPDSVIERTSIYGPRRRLAEPARRRRVGGAAHCGRPAAWRDAQGRRRSRAERQRERARVVRRRPAYREGLVPRPRGWHRGRHGGRRPCAGLERCPRRVLRSDVHRSAGPHSQDQPEFRRRVRPTGGAAGLGRLRPRRTCTKHRQLAGLERCPRRVLRSDLHRSAGPHSQDQPEFRRRVRHTGGAAGLGRLRPRRTGTGKWDGDR